MKGALIAAALIAASTTASAGDPDWACFTLRSTGKNLCVDRASVHCERGEAGLVCAFFALGARGSERAEEPFIAMCNHAIVYAHDWTIIPYKPGSIPDRVCMANQNAPRNPQK